MRWWPRSIRWQMLIGLVLLEALSIGMFALLLTRLQVRDVRDRVRHRLDNQATSLALEAEEAFADQHPEWAAVSVRMMGGAPSVLRAKITDAAGNMLYVSAGDPSHLHLDPVEKSWIGKVSGDQPRIFSLGGNRWEGVKPIFAGYELRGYAWVETDPLWDDEQFTDTLGATFLFGALWIAASAILVWLMSLLITRPLAVLHRGTRALVALPESTSAFPLPVAVNNELGDLILAFNRMVASIQEQRAGLHDTLSLLDSMLANAPIGMAFFDRSNRFVRVNHVFATLTGLPLSRHLGRTPSELLPAEVANQLESALDRVFADEMAHSELEFSGAESPSGRPWTWLVGAYPVRTTPNQVRWAGIVIRDVSERVRAEEALRRTEKLAATGRFAASIAHEINNPLEGLTNLLYLLRKFCGLAPPALEYVEMAEHETRRVAEIAQKTLRFYRQSTLPARARLAELIDSILDLYKFRLAAQGIRVERDYDPAMTLFCYEGEIRQVFANVIGNAIDATSGGGSMVIRARGSRSWADSTSACGVRFTVADTGTGMSADVRRRIFEPFFTTKEATGTGLGLWISQEIIVKHHGSVRVRSRPGGSGQPSGTVFQIFLPDDETLAGPPRAPASHGEQAHFDQGTQPSAD